jgi:hypothetical protein
MPTTTRQFTAANLTYGIEIECGINHDAPVRPGSYHAGNSVAALPSFEGRNWRADRDGSLHFADRTAVEFVSPILRGAEGLDNIRATCAQIKAWGGAVNRTCGLHVHVHFPVDDVAAMRRLTRLVGRFEDALYAAAGDPARRSGGYCRPVKTDANKRLNWNRYTSKSQMAYGAGDLGDRYRIVNWTNFLSGRMNTVEFRVFSGSLNPAKIAAWVQLCLSLVEMALDGNDAAWDIKGSSLTRWGASSGEQHVRYMTRYIWGSKTRRAANYGELGHAVFTRKAAMKTLRDLAIRHDERAGARAAGVRSSTEE